MKKGLVIVFISLFVILSTTAKNSSLAGSSNLLFNPDAQGGVMEFGNTLYEKTEKSILNSESIFLKEYSGIPLKALQFKMIVGKKGGKLILKSIKRGASIPASLFWFDYEIYKGIPEPDGSSIDTVIAVLLGNGNNVLLPGEVHHIINFEYDIAGIESDSTLTSFSLIYVRGATCAPVQDANITAGEDAEICLRKISLKEETQTHLLQNYPNPFNPNTTIKYKLPNDEHITLKVFNALGEEILTLVDEYRTEGNYESNFDAGRLTSGVYLYQIKTASFTETRKMLLTK